MRLGNLGAGPRSWNAPTWPQHSFPHPLPLQTGLSSTQTDLAAHPPLFPLCPAPSQPPAVIPRDLEAQFKHRLLVQQTCCPLPQPGRQRAGTAAFTVRAGAVLVIYSMAFAGAKHRLPSSGHKTSHLPSPKIRLQLTQVHFQITLYTFLGGGSTL